MRSANTDALWISLEEEEDDVTDSTDSLEEEEDDSLGDKKSLEPSTSLLQIATKVLL